jgi:hypothetical protein
MARQRQGGSFLKLLSFLGFVLSVLCAVYIGTQIFGSDQTQADIAQAIELAQDNQKQIKKLQTKIDSQSTSTKREISQIKSLNTKIGATLQKLEKDKSAGVVWKKNPANGHSYCLTLYPLPWHQARAWAKQQGGDLVVINDAKENDWLVRTFGGNTEFWIGLTDEKSEGKWFWVTDSPLQYANWLTGEPDNYRKSQHWGATNCKSPAKGLNDPGKWNDVVGNDARLGIVEKR